MRPVFYDFPEDSECWEVDDAYLFGADLLVAPVLEKDAVSRKVYLPSGCRWKECHTGKWQQGGCTVEAEAPEDVIPVFVKEGSKVMIEL